MADLPAFIPGLDLSERFYFEVLRPLLGSEMPGLPHSATLMGYGSDVLGLDTETSRDHNWGPRGYLLLSEADAGARADELRRVLREKLPASFLGYPVNFSQPDPRDDGTQVMEPGREGDVNSLVRVGTVEEFVGGILGRRRSREPDLLDWLTFPEQSLLELTSGRVFHDGLGTLVPVRERFAYYPDDVWLHRLSCQWQRIAQEEGFVGRCAETGDELGSRLVAGRVVRDMMRLAFLMERTYAPYSKWLGTAFARLEGGTRLLPPLARAVAADDYASREASLCQAGTRLAEMHNALGITEPLDTATRGFFGRPYQVIFASRFDAAIRERIRDDRIRGLPSRLPAVDQLTDLAGATRSPILTGRMRRIYGD